MMMISFPRSGQHLIERLLKYIHSYYKKEFSYCEYYYCCKQIPCKKNSKFQKNHDFSLDLCIPCNNKFIVLYRTNKIKQLESCFRSTLFGDKKDITIDYNNDDTFLSLISFIKEQSNYYDGFVNKYVNSHYYKNNLVIEYDSFIQNPREHIKKLIDFLNLNEGNDINLDSDIENIINNCEKIEYKNNLSEEFYLKIKNKL